HLSLRRLHSFPTRRSSDLTRGGSPRPIKSYVAPTGIPWVKIADVARSGTRYINETHEFIKPEGENKSRRVYPGDLILSNSATPRSEEHTSELQSRFDLVCR